MRAAAEETESGFESVDRSASSDQGRRVERAAVTVSEIWLMKAWRGGVVVVKGG